MPAEEAAVRANCERVEKITNISFEQQQQQFRRLNDRRFAHFEVW